MKVQVCNRNANRANMSDENTPENVQDNQVEEPAVTVVPNQTERKARDQCRVQYVAVDSGFGYRSKGKVFFLPMYEMGKGKTFVSAATIISMSFILKEMAKKNSDVDMVFPDLPMDTPGLIASLIGVIYTGLDNVVIPEDLRTRRLVPENMEEWKDVKRVIALIPAGPIGSIPSMLAVQGAERDPDVGLCVHVTTEDGGIYKMSIIRQELHFCEACKFE